MMDESTELIHIKCRGAIYFDKYTDGLMCVKCGKKWSFRKLKGDGEGMNEKYKFVDNVDRDEIGNVINENDTLGYSFVAFLQWVNRYDKSVGILFKRRGRAR